MKFISTRGGEKVNAAQAIIKGLAAGGGLFAPEKFPALTLADVSALTPLGYAERAATIISKFLDGFDEKELLAECEKAFSSFDGDDPAPLVRVDEGVYMLELWHGPTCAFADMALTLFPYLLKKAAALCEVKENLLVLTASSGDTGKATLESFKDVKGVKAVVLYPADGVSKIQKLQLGTQDGNNVDVIAVKGSFDDCQTTVKEILSDAERVEEVKKRKYFLTSANSLNIGRLLPQIAYYFSAYADLLSSEQIAEGEEVDFAVPVGNFGNAIAGFYAKKMGLPVRRIHCASNDNKVVADFLQTGEYDMNRELVKSTSPSMDVLLSSNLERLVFEASGRNAKLTAQRAESLKKCGKFDISADELKFIGETFNAGFANEETSVDAMYGVFEDVGYTMDTHTGCAMKVALDWFEKHKKDETKTVIVSTANPYKCPQDVLYAVTGNDVKDSFKGIKRLHAATAMAVPKCISALRDKPVKFTKILPPYKLFNEILSFLK